jgi:hypothetical protein
VICTDQAAAETAKATTLKEGYTISAQQLLADAALGSVMLQRDALALIKLLIE